jgi:hypothetical protein
METFQLFGPSSGTQPPPAGSLSLSNRIIIIEEPVQMFTVGWHLAGVRREPIPQEPCEIPRPEVIESLERSLTEHEDVWAELANR